MLTPYNRSQFLSRIFTDQSGQQFRMTFFVAVVDGEIKGRLVSVQPLTKSESQGFISAGAAGHTGGFNPEILCLPITCAKTTPDTAYTPAFTPVVSPYTELFFFTSQPTRAPSIR